MEPTELSHKTILIVDDEIDLREILASELEFFGATIFQAENIKQAQQILHEHKFDLVVSDIRMPGGNGIELLNYIRSHIIYRLPVILITGFADITLEEAYKMGAEALVNKPFRLEELMKLCSHLLKNPALKYS